MTIQMRAIEHSFHVHGTVCYMLYKVVPTFKYVDEVLVSDNSTESYGTVLSCGTGYYAVQGSSIQ